MRRAILGCAVVCVLVAGRIALGGAVDVTATPFNNPDWNVVDFHLVTATIGNGSDGFQEYFDLTGSKILTAPFYKNYPGVGAGPSGVAHPPPYDQDLANGLSALGLKDQTSYKVSDFSNGKGVLLSFMVVATGTTTGSSPDGDDLTIIPNAKFPIQLHGLAHKDGGAFDTATDFPIPAQTTLDPAFANVQGATHFPVFFVDNGDFAIDPKAPLPGSYDYDMTLTDASGAGFHVVVPFTVNGASAIPLPAAIWPGAMLLGGLPIARKLRRR